MSAIKRFSSGGGNTDTLDYLLTELGDMFITQDGVAILVEQSNLSTAPDMQPFYLTQDGNILTTQIDGQLLVVNY